MPPSPVPAPFEAPATASAAPTIALAPARSQDDLEVVDVTIIIGYKDVNNNRQEFIHDIVNKRIVKCLHSQEAKLEKVKVEGQLVDFAPTGEVIVKLEVKYINA